MHINIEINFNRNFLILTSVAILAIVMLIINSIYLGSVDADYNDMKNSGRVGQLPQDYFYGAPATSVALSALGFIIVVFCLSFFFKSRNDLSSTIIFFLIVAFVLLSISFALNIQMLHLMWKEKDNSTLSALNMAAANGFPINVVFMSTCGLVFLYGTYAFFKEIF